MDNITKQKRRKLHFFFVLNRCTTRQLPDVSFFRSSLLMTVMVNVFTYDDVSCPALFPAK